MSRLRDHIERLTRGAYLTAADPGETVSGLPRGLIARCFPLFEAKALLYELSMATLELLYDDVAERRQGWSECREAVAHAREAYQHTEEALRGRLEALTGSAASARGVAVHRLYLDAVRSGVRLDFSAVDDAFYQWLDSGYFLQLNSSYALAPHAVHHIMPYLASHHKRDERVALVVVDGLALWQWLAVAPEAEAAGLKPATATCLAWLPTITRLSRQAIFRGAPPQADYAQNPQSERILWRDYWGERGFASCEVQYLYDSDEFAINESTRRLAYVSVEMDERMHVATYCSDLLSMTHAYAPRLIERLLTMARMGYTVYLTADHGSVAATGRGTVATSERPYLYADGSRGRRHLMYKKEEPRDAFVRTHPELSVFTHDSYLCLRREESFQSAGAQCLTHGGCHWREVVVPFVTIPPLTCP